MNPLPSPPPLLSRRDLLTQAGPGVDGLTPASLLHNHQGLQGRGMLEDTRVICSGEFNRTPKVGRDHHHDGFSLWMAGGGVRAGPMHGVTDELGIGLAEGKVYVHDLHATLVHLPYFQYKPPTYRYARRDFQLSDVEGEIVREILA